MAKRLAVAKDVRAETTGFLILKVTRKCNTFKLKRIQITKTLFGSTILIIVYYGSKQVQLIR